MVTTLQLTFRTGTGRDFRISVENPKPNLTAGEIQSAMNTIVAKNPFNIDGGLLEAVEANIVSTQRETVTFN